MLFDVYTKYNNLFYIQSDAYIKYYNLFDIALGVP